MTDTQTPVAPVTPITFAKLSQNLAGVRKAFDEMIPLMTNRAHLNPYFVNAHLWIPPPDEKYAEFVAMLHVTIQETLLKPQEFGLRYLIGANGLVVLSSSLEKQYWASDIARPYLEAVQNWVESMLK